MNTPAILGTALLHVFVLALFAPTADAQTCYTYQVCEPVCHEECKVNKKGEYVCRDVCTTVCYVTTECTSGGDDLDDDYFDDVSDCQLIDDVQDRLDCYGEIEVE